MDEEKSNWPTYTEWTKLSLHAQVMCSGLHTGSDKDAAPGAWALITSLTPSRDIINWVHHRIKPFQNIGFWFDIT